MDHAQHAGGKIVHGLVPQARCECIARARKGDHILGSRRAAERSQRRSRFLLKGLPSASGDVCTGAVCLQAAPSAASAAPPSRLNNHVSELAGIATGAPIQLAPKNDTATNPRADRQVDYWIGSPPCSEPVLGERRGIGVIIHPDALATLLSVQQI